MHAVTYYGEFNMSATNEVSELARTLARMMCQLNHPSMVGRPLNLSAHLEPFVGRERECASRLSW